MINKYRKSEKKHLNGLYQELELEQSRAVRNSSGKPGSPQITRSNETSSSSSWGKWYKCKASSMFGWFGLVGRVEELTQAKWAGHVEHGYTINQRGDRLPAAGINVAFATSIIQTYYYCLTISMCRATWIYLRVYMCVYTILCLVNLLL